ncbi:uncharacterized protein LOC113566070 [Drosophila persimilis]|uniref:uncharacterized protein LOC113566067 n=1 Tax=Drosophila persimilis TaxID=7234 RepID=UPI000F09854D|nr:uncharacterized protein LOC113566067 [Drosophila persimilis]XP_026845801.1 uncharacterized protein LOC113566070 [Drosophila persimilis]
MWLESPWQLNRPLSPSPFTRPALLGSHTRNWNELTQVHVGQSSSLPSTFSNSSVSLQETFWPGSGGCIPCRLNGSSSPRCPHTPSSLPRLPLDGASPSALATYRSGGTGTPPRVCRQSQEGQHTRGHAHRIPEHY